MFYTIAAIIGAVVALAAGVWIGLGAPGWPSDREDRVRRPGRGGGTKLEPNHLHWLRPKSRGSESRRRR